jgi:hypothetical protein
LNGLHAIGALRSVSIYPLVSIRGFGKRGLRSSYEGGRLVGRESEPIPYFNTSASSGGKVIFFSNVYNIIVQMIHVKEYILLFTKNCISARIKEE